MRTTTDQLKKVTVLRHGEALHNVSPEAWSLGNEDLLTLTEKGFVQAKNSAFRLREYLEKNQGVKVGDSIKVKLMSSDLARARQTALVLRHYLQNSEMGGCVGSYSVHDSLREFYCVFDGVRPEGFDFDRFMKDPSSFHSELNQRDGSFKVRTSLRLMGDSDYFLARCVATEPTEETVESDSPQQEENVVVVGHHFSLNVMKVCGTWSVLAAENGWYHSILTHLFRGSIRYENREEIEEAVKGLLRDAMMVPLPNATPSPLFDPDMVLPWGSLRVRLMGINQLLSQ